MSPNKKKINVLNYTSSTSNFKSFDQNKYYEKPIENIQDFPSSFSGLWKYPSDRGIPFRNAYQWLEGKRKDDNIGNLWRIHDKLYNLEDFIKKHPGGSDWISLTRGTDITEAFETSHIINFNNVENILKKYYISNITIPRISPYTFNKNGFYKTLKLKVEPILKKVGTGPTLTLLLLQDILVILFIFLTIVGTLYNSLILQILAGIDLSMTIICAHNFFHIKDNWRKYYFDLSMFSSNEWRISHALSHHLYTNTLLDFEISMLQPMLCLLPKRKRNWWQKYASHIYVHFLSFGNMGADLLKRILNILTRKQTLRPENFIVILQLIILYLMVPSFFLALKSWILIQGVASYSFGFVGLMAAHHHPVCFHDGDEAREDPDFGLCQLDATKDRAEDFTKNLFFIATTFGEHPLHHLFPTICHSKLHHLKQVFEETISEYSIQFPKLTQLQFFLGTYQQFVRETPNTINTFEQSKIVTNGMKNISMNKMDISNHSMTNGKK